MPDKKENMPHHEKFSEKPCLMSYANNKDADQHALPRSLISVFGVHCLDRTTPVDVISKIPRLRLESVVEQAHLIFFWSETTKDRFSCDRAQM